MKNTLKPIQALKDDPQEPSPSKNQEGQTPKQKEALSKALLEAVE